VGGLGTLSPMTNIPIFVISVDTKIKKKNPKKVPERTMHQHFQWNLTTFISEKLEIDFN
jgi:hypothetical protein